MTVTVSAADAAFAGQVEISHVTDRISFSTWAGRNPRLVGSGSQMMERCPTWIPLAYLNVGANE